MMYDLIILGGGPAGYVAAHKAGMAGKSVLVIEQSQPGGVCLNAGCIPTKTLLYSAKNYKSIVEGHFHGIQATKPAFSMKEAMQWKEKVVQTYRKGIFSLFEQAHVTYINAKGKLVDRSTVSVGSELYSAKNILIATGSRPAVPPIAGLEGNPYVLTSTQLLEQEDPIEHLVIIGAGVIGLEFADLYTMLGFNVTVIEMLDQIASIVEPEIQKLMKRNLSKVQFELGAKVTKVEENTITYTKSGETKTIIADKILLATGRVPNTEDLGLEACNIKTKGRYILVNNRMETSCPRVFAAGDVVGTSLFAHSASRMGLIAVDVLLGNRNAEMEYHAIPWAIYTWPEVAGCGYAEEQAKEKGLNVLTASVPMRLSARYYAEQGTTASLVKLVMDEDSHALVGAQMIGSNASEMVWGLTMAINLGIRVEEMASTIFAHPTISEVIGDALSILIQQSKRRASHV